MTDQQIYKELAVIKDRLNDVEKRISNYFDDKHEQNKADIDYVAIMTDVDIPSKEVTNDAQ